MGKLIFSWLGPQALKKIFSQQKEKEKKKPGLFGLKKTARIIWSSEKYSGTFGYFTEKLMHS